MIESTNKEVFKGEFIKRYFTPSIEDIRVGYECETIPLKVPIEKIMWQETILSLFQIGYVEVALREGRIRVPYLTKEQIESEGWKHVWYEKGVHSWETAYEILTTFDGGYRIIIDTKGPRRLYDGECKDINTFRYITKLLGI